MSAGPGRIRSRELVPCVVCCSRFGLRFGCRLRDECDDRARPDVRRGERLWDRYVGHTRRMEKVRDWFGTPAAAAKTLIWLCWVSLLVAVFLGVFYLLALGVLAVVA
jgi:hypothetical protein